MTISIRFIVLRFTIANHRHRTPDVRSIEMLFINKSASCEQGISMTSMQNVIMLDVRNKISICTHNLKNAPLSYLSHFVFVEAKIKLHDFYLA